MQEQLPSKKQRELLSFVDEFMQVNGYGPSYREVMRGLDYKSVSTVATHVDGLITKGYLRKQNNAARSLELVPISERAAAIVSEERRDDTIAKGEWLTDIVTKKLDGLESGELNPRLLHDVQVLIDALLVLGFKDAHMQTKKRFGSIKTP